MKKNNHLVVFNLLIVTIAILALGSCKKDDNLTSSARIFQPSAIKITAGETSAKLTWTKPILSSGTVLKYSIDFAADSAFTSVKYSTTSDTAGVTVTDENLAVRTKYYARIKANATATQPESKYVISSSFQITGLQYFKTVRELEIKETSVILRFTPTTGLTSIVLTPASGTAITVTLSTTDAAAGLKTITGLTANTKYNAELYLGTRSVGYTSFTTVATTTYTTIVSATDDLAAVIAAAADGNIIGLNDGSYNLAAVATLTSKSITIKSVSNDPSATIVNFKGFAFSGAGAGLKLVGINFSGLANSATYFADFLSPAATFKNLIVENCYIHDIGTGIIRGDRASFIIGDISFKNCVIYNVTGSSSYYMFHLDKLVFTSLTLNQCTLYNFAPGLLNCKTTLTTTPPVITFNACTINNFGFNSLYVLMNASANPVNFTMTNSIIANTPYSGTVLGTILSSATSSSHTFSYNNTFNLLATSGGSAITIPTTVTQLANQTVSLGWTTTTTDFTLPTGSALRSASNTGGAIGDPRWSY